MNKKQEETGDMKIDTISYRDFKGFSGSLDLTKPTLLTGPNGSGKSARMLGPQFAVTGKTPLGGRPEDSFMLAGPVGCQVAVRLGGGLAWSRELRFDPRTKSISMVLKIVGSERMGLRLAESHLREQVGDFAPMFDLRSFLDISSDKRRGFVLNLCSGALAKQTGLEVSANRALLVEVLKIELGEGTVAAYLAEPHDDLEGLWPKLGEDKAKCLRSILDGLTIEVDANLASAISDLLETATNILNQSKGDHDRAHQAARKLSEQKATIAVTAGSVGELKEKRTDLARQLREIAEQIANQAGRADARQAIQRTIQDWRDRLAHNEQAQGGLEKIAAADAARQAELEESVRRMGESTAPPDLAQLLKACEIAQADKFAANEAVRNAEHSAQMCEGDIQSLTAEITSFRSCPWGKALELFEEIAAYGRDRPAEREDRAWGELGDLIRKNAAVDRRLHLEKQLLSVRASLESVKATVVTAMSKQTEAIVTLDMNNAHLEVAQKEAELAAKTDRVSRETRAIAQKELFDITRRQDNLKEVKATGERLRTEQAKHERRLNELEAAGGHVPLEELREQESNLDRLQAEVDLELEAKERYQVLDTELVRCVASAEDEALLYETCKSVCAAIRTMRERLMERLIAPLLDKVNCFLAIAEPECRAYCELLSPRGRPVFELGWIRRRKEGMEQRIPLPALSGGETAIFGAALAYALVALSDSPLKLLLLEAGEVDEVHLARILEALWGLRQDLSNVLVATHLRPRLTTLVWNTVLTWNTVDLWPSP